MFGCTALDFEPHSISVAKALTSAYVPMAAVTVPETMYQAMLDESRKIGTFGHAPTPKNLSKNGFRPGKGVAFLWKAFVQKNFQVREKIPGYPEEAAPRGAPGPAVVRRQRRRHRDPAGARSSLTKPSRPVVSTRWSRSPWRCGADAHERTLAATLTAFWRFPQAEYAASDGPYPCRGADAKRR